MMENHKSIEEMPPDVRKSFEDNACYWHYNVFD